MALPNLRSYAIFLLVSTSRKICCRRWQSQGWTTTWPAFLEA
uniref:Uncharacterized protein n=1 Tax=Arundo donax TaxID=35708 RepID=A0A0A9B772_ARUDO